MSRRAVAEKDRGASPLVWAPFLLLCIIAIGAAARRLIVMIGPPSGPSTLEQSALDGVFVHQKILTLFHILPATAFVVLAILWALPRIRAHAALHRWITYGLLIFGAVVGVTVLLLSRNPIGGLNEAFAAVLYDCLFLFSLARVGWMLHARDSRLHREWMLRAISVLMGIATTRPVVGVFFATERITHLHPAQFFGIAFWIGFTTTYIAGEAYIRSHPLLPAASDDRRLKMVAD